MTQTLYDWWPGYKFGTLIYNTTFGDGDWTAWEVLDATSVLGLGAGRGIQVFQRWRLARESARRVADASNKISDWLGPGARAVKNDADDLVLLSKDGTRRVRFDVNRPYPHKNPHAHVDELVNGKWVKSGQIYPRNVLPE